MTVIFSTLDEDPSFSDEQLREWSWARKQLELSSLLQHAELEEEAAALQPTEAAASGLRGDRKAKSKRKKKPSGLAGRMLASRAFAGKVLDHLQISLDRLHARFEDRSHSDAPFAVGLALDAITTQAGDSASAKRVVISGLRIYHSDRSDGPVIGSTGADTGRTDLIAGRTHEPAVLMVLLRGPSLRSRLTVGSPVAASASSPPVSAEVDVSDIGVRLTQAQLVRLPGAHPMHAATLARA